MLTNNTILENDMEETNNDTWKCSWELTCYPQNSSCQIHVIFIFVRATQWLDE